MTSLDLSGIITRICSDLKSRFDARYQATLIDGVNIKKIGSQPLLGIGNLSVSDIGAATEAHSHGSITKTGSIRSDTTVASGDKLVITDNSANSMVARSGIAFGTSTTTFLANNGTWQTPDVWTTVPLSDFATEASGWAFSTSNCNVQYNAALGAVRVRLQIAPSAAQTAGQKTLFTVKSEYRPKTFAVSLSSITSNAQAGQLYTSGGFASNIVAINANVNLYFNGVYFIGA